MLQRGVVSEKVRKSFGKRLLLLLLLPALHKTLPRPR